MGVLKQYILDPITKIRVGSKKPNAESTFKAFK